jgi:REP element-mobilizing transposase RayT
MPSTNTPKTKRQHLRLLVAEKQHWSGPPSPTDQAAGFLGWHERGYLPHCDKPGLVQFITFRLWDSLPASRRSEWEHWLSHSAHEHHQERNLSGASLREQRIRLEEYLDRSLGECYLRNESVAALAEQTLRHHHGRHFQMLAWVIMPNHIHALIEIGSVPLGKTVQNWKSIIAVSANKLLGRTGRFWQPEYWDRYMRDTEQTRKAICYIENNPVKAKFCRTPEAWPFSSARFRDPKTAELILT